MVYIDLLDAKLSAEPCVEVDNGNGTFSYRKANNKIFCLTNEGNVEERDNPGGPWESFKKTTNALIAERDWNGKTNCFIRPYIEIK